ncbi:cytochrome c oxidase assembly protein [Sphingomonas sp. IC4-52]|uniref:cytochrome c oxidase assembly protein n=1 Tax=Sphingomonas sp. IC4-52 TaxID=2887202 RepID=UPI001D0FA254|nr:cytochrome c oxidase assembly protein [Sphingomonas sp. IC4-52]MCC2980969.1 cytochrome c oxidase assembly protein [Sphingomonas sp. IC4-52]
MRRLIRLSLLCAAALPGAALAHGGHDHGEPPGWTWDPWITMPLFLSALLFAIGWRRLYARSAGGQPRLRRRAWLFAAGWATLAGALVSPLHEAGERSFTAHMIEHELLMLLAAPLIVLAEPLSAMLWAFPPAARRALGRISASRPISVPFTWASGAVVATLIQAAVLWIWHMPTLFDVALASEGWHATQHLCFIVSALLFWTAMLGRRGAAASALGDRALAAFCLLVTSFVTGALGALMAFSDSPWYAGYARLALAPFGLSPAEDQQVAGLIMWVPGGLVHLAAALALFRTLLVPQRSADAV